MIIATLMAIVLTICIVLFLLKRSRDKKGGDMRYGIQTFDRNGNILFDSTTKRLRLIGEYIVSAKSERVFTFPIKDDERLVGWLLPINDAPHPRWDVTLKVEHKRIICYPRSNGLDNSHQYKLIVGVY